MACTTTILNSSEISDMKVDICFISLSTLLSLPVCKKNIDYLSFEKGTLELSGTKYTTCTKSHASPVSSQYLLSATVVAER